jgi:hypothetical protein
MFCGLTYGVVISFALSGGTVNNDVLIGDDLQGSVRGLFKILCQQLRELMEETTRSINLNSRKRGHGSGEGPPKKESRALPLS